MLYLTKQELLTLEAELRSMKSFKVAYTATERVAIHSMLMKVQAELKRRHKTNASSQGSIKSELTA